MYFYGPLHMAEQNQGNQLEPIYSSSVRIRGVALRTYQKRGTIGSGGDRVSGISMPMAQQDDVTLSMGKSCLVSLFNGISNFMGYLISKS